MRNAVQDVDRTKKRSPLNLLSLLTPRAVAVVGATDKIASFSGGSIFNLQRHGYAGNVYPVNPNRSEVQGLTCYPSLDVLPRKIDSVVIVTRADLVVGNIRLAAAAGAKSALVVSSGIGEGASGVEGARRKEQLMEVIAETGITVLGPNSIGLVNLFDAYVPRSNSNQLSPQYVRPGPIALFTQSGAVNNIVYNRAQAAGIGIGLSVATGVQIGVNVWDLIDHALADQRIEVICVMVEGLGAATEYVPALQRAQSSLKPVILLRAGRTAVGSATAQTHSGALAGNWDIERSLLTELGVTIVDDIDQLWEVASIYRWWGKAPSQAPSCGVFALSGGEAALLADQATDEGFTLPPVSSEFSAVAREFFPLAGVGNPFDPVDMLSKPDAGLPAYGAFVTHNDFDVYICAMHMQSAQLITGPLKELQRDGKRVAITWWPVPNLTDDVTPLLLAFEGPVFEGSHRFLKAMKKWSAAAEVAQQDDPIEQSVAAHVLAEKGEELTYWQARDVLSQVGIPFADARRVSCERDALDAVRTIGFPVVMKADVTCNTHKAAAGLVVLGISDADATKRAYLQLASHSKGHVVIEKQVTGFLQLFVGVAQDAGIGAVIVFGAGGSAAEYVRDTALLPCSHVNVSSSKRLMQRTHIGRFLTDAYPAVATQVVDVLLQLGSAARECSVSVDINPLLVCLNPPRLQAVDARIIGAHHGR